MGTIDAGVRPAVVSAVCAVHLSAESTWHVSSKTLKKEGTAGESGFGLDSYDEAVLCPAFSINGRRTDVVEASASRDYEAPENGTSPHITSFLKRA